MDAEDDRVNALGRLSSKVHNHKASICIALALLKRILAGHRRVATADFGRLDARGGDAWRNC